MSWRLHMSDEVDDGPEYIVSWTSSSSSSMKWWKYWTWYFSMIRRSFDYQGRFYNIFTSCIQIISINLNISLYITPGFPQTLSFFAEMKLSKSDAKASAPYLLVWAILLLSGSSGLTTQNSNKMRLYNSHDSYEGQYPFVVYYIRRKGKVYFSCTGGLIDPQWVITAAHCFIKEFNPRDNIFVAGKADLHEYIHQRFHNLSVDQDIDEEKLKVQERRALKFFTHPLQSVAGSHDVGLVKLDRPFELNRKVQVIPLAVGPFTRPMECSAAGFGLTEKSVRRYHLQTIENVLVKPNILCRFQKFRDLLCLGDESYGICYGDSGGPLVCNGELRGIASHGLSTSPKCGEGVVEQYYADIFSNLNWIKTVIDEN